MSWATFKSTLLTQMQSGMFGNNMDAFAKAFTMAYDMSVKTGGDSISRIPMIKGNTTLMEQNLKLFLNQTQKSDSLTLLDVIGPAIISYWGGGMMANFPPPLIPAPGALQNIVTVQGMVISPGVWNPIVVQPNSDSQQFLDMFINSAKLHLTTISGMFVVTAQYPPPAPPAPGVVMWNGYTIT
jgi:hypothetical protein